MANDWLNPLNAIKLQNAVRLRQKSVTLKFDIDAMGVERDHKMNIAYNDNKDKFWLQPRAAMTPCGWYDIERVLNPLFLERN